MAQVSINLRATDNVSSVINQLEQKIKKLRKSSENIRITASSVGGGKASGNAGAGMFGSLLGANLAAQGIQKLGEAIVVLGKSSLEQARMIEQAQKRLSFAAGGRYGGQGLMERTGQFAANLGLNKASTIESFSSFAVSAGEAGLTSQQSQSVFENTSKAIAAMGLSAEDTKGVFLAFSQMLGKGTVSSEELRQQLAERIPGAMALAAKSMKMTMPEFIDKLEKGEIQSKKFVMGLTDLFGKQYGKAAEDNLDSLEGRLNTLDNSFFDLKSAIAEAFGPATLSAISTLAAGISGLTTLTKIFFGESMEGAGKLKAAGFANTAQGKEIAKMLGEGNVEGIKKGAQKSKQEYESNIGALSASIGSSSDLQRIIGGRLSGKLTGELDKNRKLRELSQTPGYQNAENAAALEASNASLTELTKKAQARIEAAPRTSALARALQASPLGTSPVGSMINIGGALTGASQNDQILDETQKLLTSVQNAGIAADAWNTAASDISKIKKEEKETASLTGKEPKSDKIKSDFHTPRIVNINILTGDGASLINGGIQNDFNSQSVDVNSFRTQIQSVVEQTMMDVVTNAGSSLARVTTNKYN
jgi:tape measure domain-containing protein